MESQFVASVRKSAEESFASGLYCAESVALALAQAQGLDSDLVPKVATAFCSGMSRTCGTCGALTGAIMGVSLALGRAKASEPVQPSYAVAQRLIREFEQAFGARDCNVLLGCDLNTPEGQATYRENHLGERCARYTGKAAEIAARLVTEAQQRFTCIETISELDKVVPLLAECDLPVSDIAPSNPPQFFGIRCESALVAVVGLERFASAGLLRSLAVAPAHRGRGLAQQLVAFAERVAAAQGINTLFLLTTSAAAFFEKLGFVSTSRRAAPPAIQATPQFSSLCPASSAFLSKTVDLTSDNTATRNLNATPRRHQAMDAIGTIHTPYKTKQDCPIQPLYASGVTGRVEVLAQYAEGLKDIETFSHIYLLYLFDRADAISLVRSTFLDDTPHGIYASRHPCRPNGIGMSIVRLLRREDNVLIVEGADMLDETPLLDIKPYIPKFDAIPTACEGWTAGKQWRQKPEGRE